MATEKKSDEPEETGYAVFDNTLLRFTSGVGSKKDAEAAKKNGPSGHDLEVRKV